jgi:hypothetical protein
MLRPFGFDRIVVEIDVSFAIVKKRDDVVHPVVKCEMKAWAMTVGGHRNLSVKYFERVDCSVDAKHKKGRTKHAFSPLKYFQGVLVQFLA